MKVILKQDVKSLGKKESILEVSDGYAKNFLIPKGLAVLADSNNINIMNTKKDAEKTKKDRELAQAKALGEKLSEITVIIKSKAGEHGKLFGSITSKDISDRLKKDFNFDIDKKKINLEEPIKLIGSTSIDVKLYPGVVSKITVKTVQE